MCPPTPTYFLCFYLLGNHTVTLIFMSYYHHNPLSLFCNLGKKDEVFIVLLTFIANKNGIVCQPAVNMKKKKKINFRKQLSVCLFGYKRWWGIYICSCTINLSCKLYIVYSKNYAYIMHNFQMQSNLLRYSKTNSSKFFFLLCWFLFKVLI